MAPLKQDEWELPRLFSSFGFEDDSRFLAPDDRGGRRGESEFMAVQFYPYISPREEPVFALCSAKHVLICRLSPGANPSGRANPHPVQVIQMIRDENDKWDIWALTWAMDVDGSPLLCFAGDARIKVFDVKRQTQRDALVGHGDDIHDLKTSPTDPLIVASASKDTTVRVWSLKAEHKAQPCMYILGGDSHQFDLLTVAFHSNGRFILSSGNDQIVNLWSLSDEMPSESKPSTAPIQIFHPHFSTSEVHSALIDCVGFYEDMILSRACYEQKIVLWSIEGFSSSCPLPPRESAPSNYDQNIPTRSAFSPGPVYFSRHLELQTKGMGEVGEMFYMRFGLFTRPNKHPVLAFGNARSKVFFWDFQRFESFEEFNNRLIWGQPAKAPDWLPAVKSKGRSAVSFSGRDAGSSDGRDAQGNFEETMLASWNDKYGMANPTKQLPPHQTALLPTSRADFVARQASWSPSGEWCVVVGSNSQCAILRRWHEK